MKSIFRVIIVIGVITNSFTQQVINLCAQGLDYWCLSQENAMRCGVTLSSVYCNAYFERQQSAVSCGKNGVNYWCNHKTKCGVSSAECDYWLEVYPRQYVYPPSYPIPESRPYPGQYPAYNLPYEVPTPYALPYPMTGQIEGQIPGEGPITVAEPMAGQYPIQYQVPYEVTEPERMRIPVPYPLSHKPSLIHVHKAQSTTSGS